MTSSHTAHTPECASSRDEQPECAVARKTSRPLAPLYGVEIANLAYGLFTVVLTLLFMKDLSAPVDLLIERALVLSGIGGAYALDHLFPSRATRLLRYAYPISLLAYWYPDTYNFCQLFPNLDHLFAYADQWLFGFQPAALFARRYDSVWWSEAFNLGYFSYYIMIVLAVVLPLCVKPQRFAQTAFVMMACFFFYYIIYLFLPVAGPQFYFPVIGERMVEAGHFPQLFDYFRFHSQLLPNAGPEGPFRHLVEMMQAGGERPTAAFPSSHVGMSTVILFLLWRIRRSAVYVLLPFYLLLCGATVYIEAHYFIDVLGGLVTAVLFHAAAQRLWALPFFDGERHLSPLQRSSAHA